jgi:hypothetical protein
MQPKREEQKKQKCGNACEISNVLETMESHKPKKVLHYCNSRIKKMPPY